MKPRYSIPRSSDGWHRYLTLTPSKHPYAPDCSCPDFAHDDQHIEAIAKAHGHGFPYLARTA
jgi:hypothetical protein